MSNKAIKLFSIVFIIIWTTIIFAKYWLYDQNIGKSLELFQYYDLLAFISAIGAGLAWLLKKRKNKSFKYVNGLSIFLTFILLNIISICFFYGKLNGLDLKIVGLFSQIGHFIGVAFCLFLVYLVIRLIGTIFTSVFPLNISQADLPLIQIALGLIIFTSSLFILGLLGMLFGFILVPIGIILLAIFWRHTIQIIKSTLFTTIRIPKELNTLGVFSFLILSLFLVYNYTLILRPFPIGTDSLNLYINIPALISDYHGLVSGNQPYNWSLFISTGLIVFGRVDVVLGLSFLGGLFSLFTLFRLSRKWLNVNYAAFLLLLFYSTPMINFLSYMDMKVDMGLLFITLTMLLLYYNWIVAPKNEKPTIETKGIGLKAANAFFKKRIPSILKQNRLLVILGLLAGFAFGIKLTTLFTFLALHCTIWFIKGGKLPFIASFLLCFSAVFILKLDAQPGLRQFHAFVPLLQWSLLTLGLGSIVYLFIKRKEKLLKLMTYSLIFSLFFVLPILPWLGKNLNETGEVSIHSLLNGKLDSPVFNFKKIKTNPNKSENNNKQKNKKDEEAIIPGIYQLPDDVSDKDKIRNKDLNKSFSEDMHRFMGYEILPIRYLSLPFDVFTKTNITKHFTDGGFVLLLLFPILFLFPSKNNFDLKSVLSKFSFILLCTALLVISIPSAFLNHNGFASPIEGMTYLDSKKSSGLLENISDTSTRILLEVYAPIYEFLSSIYNTKDPITYITLILLFLVILSLVYTRVKSHSKVTQSIIAFTLIYFFLWWILGSGMGWYGMLIFTIPYIFLLKTINSEKEDLKNLNWASYLSNSAKKIAIISLGFTWVFIAFVQRSSNYEPISKENAKHLYYPSIMEYQMKNLTENKLTDYHFPSIRELANIINQDKRSLVLRIGSPINYFIDKNDSRVLSDTFLELFDRIVQKYRSKEKIIDALKAEGFKYIVFDLNMASYDKTPGKTLTRKFTQFLNTLYKNPKVELVATNRILRKEGSGQDIFGVFPDEGTIVVPGKIALYRIK